MNGFEKKLWGALVYNIWTIWFYRNQLVNEKKDPNWEEINVLVKLRLGFWAKGWDDEFPFSPEDMIRNLGEIRGW